MTIGTVAANGFLVDTSTLSTPSASIETWLATGNQVLTMPSMSVTVPISVSVSAIAPREFNRYINASDLLEEFIVWLGGQGVRQQEVMKLLMGLFTKWLIIRACEEDGEEPNIEMPVLFSRNLKRVRCQSCGKFMCSDTPVPLYESCAGKCF